MNPAEELVLVVPRTLFDETGTFQGLNPTPEPYLRAFLHSRQSHFLPRSIAENNPNFKQIIPYCILTAFGQILHYTRSTHSGEKRLATLGSIGFGGHINPSDQKDHTFNSDAYHRALTREIHEELHIESPWAHQQAIGIINDDSTEVGKVHLGIVHLITLQSTKIRPAESTISNLEFLNPHQLLARKHSLESWSRIILENWAQIENSIST